MKYVEQRLLREKQQINIMLRRAKKRMEKAPAGNLRIREWKGRVEYYYKGTEECAKSRYLKKGERELVNKIAQRDYDLMLIRNGEKIITAIERFLKLYAKLDLRAQYEKIPLRRKNLIEDAFLSDEEFAKRWQETEYVGNPYPILDRGIITEKGEIVRSKSEKIIADKLFKMGIPYKYECPLILESGEIVYPDFTMLDISQRKEKYLEHFGLMGKADYVERMVNKYNSYCKNNIVLGDNLFFTFETSDIPLNIKSLEKILHKIQQV